MAIDIKKAKRVVVKVGSSLMVDQAKGSIRETWLQTLVEDLAELQKQGKEVVVVTSGAVALGRQYITSAKKVLKLEEKQAAAACGQTELVRCYQRCLDKHKIKAAQILLTLFDSETRRNYLNAKNTIQTLLKHKVIPIINENDTVATHELRFGDNDRLAARVAQMIGADLLILFSDIDGLYSANPRITPGAVLIEEVHEVTPEIERMAGGALSSVGSGGMITKIAAAKIAIGSGCHMVIAEGSGKHPLRALEKGAKCTVFRSSQTPVSARKKWIASSLNVEGSIIIDDGALKALQNGKSLLPAGVIDVVGEFSRGDTVSVKDCHGTVIGCGLSAYGSADATLIKGHQSKEIENIIGFTGRNELIHRDDFVLQVKES